MPYYYLNYIILVISYLSIIFTNARNDPQSKMYETGEIFSYVCASFYIADLIMNIIVGEISKNTCSYLSQSHFNKVNILIVIV